jgi:hypothetical protein
MNSIQIEVPRVVKRLAMFGLRDSSKRTKRGRKFATVDPFTIPANLKDMSIVLNFFGNP